MTLRRPNASGQPLRQGRHVADDHREDHEGVQVLSLPFRFQNRHGVMTKTHINGPQIIPFGAFRVLL